jgi:3-(3-hydroxy-phenyl)propionate hydroxylase
MLHEKKPELSDYTIQYCHPENPVTCARGPGLRRRWEFALTDNERHQPVNDALVWDRLRPWLNKEEAQLERYAVYEFHSTLALKWRKNRLFIAGDTAHQTPPFMGQGMCAGIRDVANLAWKLTLSLTRNPDPRLLDSYEQERIDHVRSYITTAINLGLLINSNSEQDLFEKLNSPDGKMKSIVPKLGKGLNVQENSQVGTICPQPTLTHVSDQPTLLDDHCGYAPVLLINSEWAEILSDEQSSALDKFQSAGMCVVCSELEPQIADVLNQLQIGAALIRADRYILSTSTDTDEFDVLLEQIQLIKPSCALLPGAGHWL